MSTNVEMESLPELMEATTSSIPAANVERHFSGQRVGVLIVAYNAITTLTKVLNRIPEKVWKDIAEVVVFDDASQDATYELGVGYKTVSGNPKLMIYRNQQNLGYGGNQKAGYRYFMEKGFDVVVLLHGDGQYAPELLAEMYEPIIAGQADAVFGSRMMQDRGGPLKGGMPLYKYLGNRILSVSENLALGTNLTEFHSGYRAYSLKALRQLNFSHMTDNFHFDTEIIIKLLHQGFRIKEIPIPTYYGDEICYVNGMQYARDVMRAVYRYKMTARSVQRYPEFEEYFVHYPLKHARHSSHDLVQQQVERDKRVLDLGCGEGFFAEQIRQQGNSVVGVDVIEQPSQSDALDAYIRADLSRGLDDILDKLGDQKFDRVLLLDIIEHLPAPERLLQDCHAVLNADGQIIVSVPNVANITVRLGLLFGRFNYTERGILDKTHMRFFTRKTIRHLLELCDYRIIREKATIIPFEIALGVSPENRLAKFFNNVLALLTNLLPGLLAYQLILVARSEPTQSESRSAQVNAGST